MLIVVFGGKMLNCVFGGKILNCVFGGKILIRLKKKTKKTYGYPQPNKINPYRLFFIWVQNPF